MKLKNLIACDYPEYDPSRKIICEIYKTYYNIPNCWDKPCKIEHFEHVTEDEIGQPLSLKKYLSY